jgi:hypothetical protein
LDAAGAEVEARPTLDRGAAGTAREGPLVSLGVGFLGFIGVIVALVLLILITVVVAVVLGLLGLESLTGVTVFAGLLVAAIIVFLLVLAAGFVAQAVAGLALGRLVVRGEGRSFPASLGALLLVGRGTIRRQVAEPVGSASPAATR